MKNHLTIKQKKILSTILDLQQKLGKSPTLKEIYMAMKSDYSGISSIQRHVNTLKEKGYISNEKHQARSLELSLPEQIVNIPLVGSAPCGAPFLAIENIEAYIPYKKSLLRGDPKNYFFLQAVGDSMNKADISGKNIDSGDFVLVRKQQTADFGKRVVALIGDDATIKKLIKAEGHMRLEPESTNPDNKAIILFDNFSIQGEVVDVIKKEVDN